MGQGRIAAPFLFGALFWVSGAMLLLYCGVLFWMGSIDLTEDHFDLNPIVILTSAGVIAGLGYVIGLFSFHLSDNSTIGWRSVSVIMLLGLSCRIILFFSSPVAEHDPFRYLWDGGVTAAGLNPYIYSPSAILSGMANTEFLELALEPGASAILSRVAYPDLTTLYPPVAQAIFAIAHAISPWSLTGWKLIILLFDCAAVLFLLSLLRRLQLSPGWILIYWWNPLLLRYGHNSLHMDVALLLFLSLILFSLERNRWWTSLFTLCAIGTKLWPLALSMLINRKRLSAKNLHIGPMIVTPLLGSGIIMSMIWWQSSIADFASDWRVNDGLFTVLATVSDILISPLLPYIADAEKIARLIYGMIVGLVCLWVTWRGWTDLRAFAGAALIVISTLFFLSPTGYPWYALWLLPFLTIRPYWPFHLLPLTLPLYELRFWYEGQPNALALKQITVTIEFLPIAVAMLVAFFIAHQFKSKGSPIG